MNNITNLYKTNPNVLDIIKKSKGSNYSLFCNGMTTNHNVLLASTLYQTNKDYVLYICDNAFQANRAYDNFCEILGYERTNLYIVDDIASIEAVVVSNELKQERLNTIKSILDEHPVVICTHIEAMLKPLVSLERIKSKCQTIKKGSIIDTNTLIKDLVNIGYERVHTTYNIGEFSVRGEVIDIFISCYTKPIRINIAFDEVESIKYFNLETQLTLENVNEATIFPMTEIVFDKPLSEIQNDITNIYEHKLIYDDFSEAENLRAYGKLTKYLKYIDKNYCTLIDYFINTDSKFHVLYDDIKSIHSSYEASVYETNEYYKGRFELSMFDKSRLELVYLDDINNFESKINCKIYLAATKKGLPRLELMGVYEFNGYKVIDYQNDMQVFIKDIKETTEKTFLAFKEKNRLDLIKEMFDEANVNYSIIDDFFHVDDCIINLIICENPISYGNFSQYKVIAEDQIFKKSKASKSRYRSVQENTIVIGSKDDLHVGDYVVHYDYGISKYLGIKTVELKGIKNDYLQLQYDNMVLLVPMEKITELEKYIGSEGVVPRLTKIGTSEWEKRKKAVSDQLETIAKDLIDLQVKREAIKGYTYHSDSDFQKMFEADFEFEETKDQTKIVEEIKEEMEKGVLIDRLVCGDVGFGKTEIAMRIAFKTVYEGKQVAYMAPTTILTRQHYHSFFERFNKYGIKVALLNRMVDPSIQKNIIKQLKNGEIDIIIGTHRLLNEEIQYKDLGLLVVDEEQRFGVVHKERIKRIKNNINVLTLTATPIPRTLQMAVTGIRTLSLLETAPKDRYPIQTYVMEYNDTIIRDAIYRELARNGQVFYLHNKISDIEQVAKKISKLVPEAKICIGHGKMEREHLEDVITNYIDGKYNVLICTTIIETGIDIPNSNTLIIDNAEKLGLAQMYQIRGRVVRSDRIAYAYFTYNSDKVLTGPSEKRLAAIKEFTKIGSGYKIAVRDLAIRGAGDILGKEQSGFINSIGIDMYMKLLNKAVNKVKGVEEKERINYKIEVSKHVEREYVDDDTIIIYIHKEINSINSNEDKENTIIELTDRFGKLSKNILDYIEERYLESLLRLKNITKLIEATNLVTIVIPKEVSSNLKGDIVVMTGYKMSDRFSFEYRGGQFVVMIKKEEKDRTWLYLATEFFEKIFINV